MEEKQPVEEQSTPRPTDVAPPASQPPDGGVRAWLQVAGVSCLYFSTWGLVSSYGTYQAIYETRQLQAHSPFEISVIGSLQLFLMVFSGFLTGPVYDAGYMRHLMATGSALIVVGTVLQSLCSRYWQYLLTQGLLVGLGAGCLAIPTVAIPAQWFTTRLPIANGMAASGSGLGGVVLPIMIKRMEAEVGLSWAVRAAALIFLVLLGFANVVLQPRTEEKGQKVRRSLVDPSAFTDWPYLSVAFAFFATFMGLYTPFVHVPRYALTHDLASENLAFYMVAILNSSSIVGRIIPLLVAQKLGPMNMIIVTGSALGITGLCLMTATSEARLIGAIVVYGFFAGTFFALMPTLIVRLTSDVKRVGTRFGMAFALNSVACLFGPPVAGALLRRHGYDGAWIWAGVMLLIGTALNTFARMNKTGWTIKGRV